MYYFDKLKKLYMNMTIQFWYLKITLETSPPLPQKKVTEVSPFSI